MKTTRKQNSSTRDIASHYDLRDIEIANHWNDLYTHGGGYGVAIIIEDDKDAETVKHLPGTWLEVRNRAGEHHWTIEREGYSVDDIRGTFGPRENNHFYWESVDDYMESRDFESEEDRESTRKYAEDWLTWSDGTVHTDGGGNHIEEPTPYRWVHDVYEYRMAFLPDEPEEDEEEE